MTAEEVVGCLMARYDQRFPEKKDSFSRQIWKQDLEERVSPLLRMLADAGLEVRAGLLIPDETR